MKKAAFLIAVFCAGVLSICYFSGNAGAGDAHGLLVNKLKCARQWKALQEYMGSLLSALSILCIVNHPGLCGWKPTGFSAPGLANVKI